MSRPAKTLNRREAMKVLAGVVGAAALASVRSQWKTPLVQIGALPAHAQCSAIGPNMVRDVLTNGTGTVFSYSYSTAIGNGGITLDPGETGPLDLPVGIPFDVEMTLCGVSSTFTHPGVPEEFAGLCIEETILCLNGNNNLMLP